MKRIMLSLTLAALSCSSFATIVVHGTAQGSTETISSGGITITTTVMNCPGDGTCMTIACAVNNNGDPVTGSNIELDIYKDDQVATVVTGVLQAYQSWQDPNNGPGYY